MKRQSTRASAVTLAAVVLFAAPQLACQFIAVPEGPFPCDGREDCNPNELCLRNICTPTAAEQCTNGIDDDGDSLIDCQDSDCAGACTRKEDCANGADDDGDTFLDCADPECAGFACGPGCVCGNQQKQELNCGDGQDNDGDTVTDCADGECANVACGTGCVCANQQKRETLCSDGQDNDGDTKSDCQDSDCGPPHVAEICNDGVDNNCDRGVDCGDAACELSPLCSDLIDGAPCTISRQCRGNRCRAERTTGYPNGYCVTEMCDVAADTGCNGGSCFGTAGVYTVCYAKCTGNGMGVTGRCRPGYACYGASNGRRYCLPVCDLDEQCSIGSDTTGCNPYSRLCGVKDSGKKKYGAACASAAECESGLCNTNQPGGYCFGVCSGIAKTCGPGGICNYDAAGDGQGTCRQACSAGGAECTRGSPYTCITDASQLVCWCRPNGLSCSSNTDCCSRNCNLGTGTCAP